MVLGDDTVRVIFSYHPEKPKDKYHIQHHGHKRKGVRSLHLKERPARKISKEDQSKGFSYSSTRERPK